MYYKRIKNTLLTEDTAVTLLTLSIILLIVFLLCHLYPSCKLEEGIGGLTGGVVICVISVANTILLYLTLTSQNNGIASEKAARRQEHFETTFFNQLETQRKLKDEISFTCEAMDENANLLERKVNGREFFSFAINEILLISESLKSIDNKKYEESDIEGAFRSIEEKYDRDDPTGMMDSQKQNEEKGLIMIAKIRFYNSVYNICKDDRQQYPFNPQIPYTLFRNQKYMYFEHYIRSLYYLLLYISDEKRLDEEAKRTYITIVQSQMSRDELTFVDIHAQSFPAFREILDKTHLTDIITNNKI